MGDTLSKENLPAYLLVFYLNNTYNKSINLKKENLICLHMLL